MKRTSAGVLAASLALSNFVAPSAVAAVKTNTVSLVCEMKRLLDNEKLQFSVVLDESARLANINGTVFPESQFEPYTIKGKISEPHHSVAGVMRQIDFSLDRLTGTLHFGIVPIAESGSFTEDQKERLAALPFDPVFLGKCAVRKPMF